MTAFKKWTRKPWAMKCLTPEVQRHIQVEHEALFNENGVKDY